METAIILVVDGQPLVLDALTQLARQILPAARCLTAANVREARQRCAENLPGVIMLDLALQGGDSLDLIREFLRMNREALVLVLTALRDKALLYRALRAGARGLLSKLDTVPEIARGLRAVLAGQIFVSGVFGTESVTQLLQGDGSGHAGEVSPLSNRELFIFKLLGRNLGPTAIAAELGVSVKTVETHQHRIKQKLRLPSCPDLRFRAHEWVLKAELMEAPCSEPGAD